VLVLFLVLCGLFFLFCTGVSRLLDVVIKVHEFNCLEEDTMKNLCAKTRPLSNPYEVWESGDGWRWLVLKKWQADDAKPYARWFCFVTSPFCPDGEYGDTYVTDVTRYAHCVQVEGAGLVEAAS
jgi:hypothetical protein